MPVDLNLVASFQKLSYCHAEYFHYHLLLVLLDVAVKALTVVVYLIATLAIGVYVCCIYTAACSDNLVFCGAISRCVHIPVLVYTNLHIVMETSSALVFFFYHSYPLLIFLYHFMGSSWLAFLIVIYLFLTYKS